MAWFSSKIIFGMILVFSILLCQINSATAFGEYGESSNSQVGSISSAVNAYDMNSRCLESEPTSSCVTKSGCCHVTNNYGGYTYSACVDTQTTQVQEFCINFYGLNAKEGFVASECACNNYIHISSSFLKISQGYLISIFILFYLLI